jgi:hypothetical protein
VLPLRKRGLGSAFIFKAIVFFFLSKNGGMDIFNFNVGSVLEPPSPELKKNHGNFTIFIFDI